MTSAGTLQVHCRLMTLLIYTCIKFSYCLSTLKFFFSSILESLCWKAWRRQRSICCQFGSAGQMKVRYSIYGAALQATMSCRNVALCGWKITAAWDTRGERSRVSLAISHTAQRRQVFSEHAKWFMACGRFWINERRNLMLRLALSRSQSEVSVMAAFNKNTHAALFSLSS